MTSTVIEADRTAEIQVESIAELAQFITGSTAGHTGHINPVVQVSDGTPILQVQDAINNGTIIQVSDSSVQPVVQVGDQGGQGVFITDGVPGGIQILDGSFPSFVQSSDGTSIIQLAPSIVSGAAEGLTQVVQLPGGQIALIEQQENIDPQNVQHFVFEQVPVQQNQMDGEIQQQQQQLMEAATPVHIIRKDTEETQPPIGKGPFTCDICEKVFEKWNQYQRHLRSHEDDKPFRCPHCTSSYNIADNLKLHLATHVEPGDKPMCPECGKKFSRVASLKAHIMLHEKEESLMCQECGDEFGLQSQLDRHMIEHRDFFEGSRTYSCRQCSAEFMSQKALKEHTKQHFKVKASLSHRSYKKEIDRSGFSHKCNHCWKSFQKPSQLLRHTRVHTGDRPFKCSICSKAFNQKGALQIHILGRHSEKKPHTCQFCGTGFSQKGNLRAHIGRVHTLSEENAEGPIHACQECPCMFRKLGSLNAHISRFHTEMTTQDAAALGKSLNKKVLMKSQGEEGDGAEDGAGDVIQQLLELSEAGGNSSSTQQQQQQQQQLDTATGQQSSENSEDILQQALQNSGVPGGEDGKEKSGRHEKAGTKIWMAVRDSATGTVKKHCVRKLGNQTWHQCAFCTKEFKKPSDLVRHTRIHSHEKPYKCTQCFRAFAVKSTLNSHIRTHTGIKEFKCSICDKSFSTHGSLKVHLRLHTGARPYECPHCDKKFRTSAHRKSHMFAHFKNPEEKAARISLSSRKTGMRDASVPDIPLQEPILITDTGLIQQPPRSTMFNQYLGESGSVDRPYKCGHCQRGFKKSSHLKQHIRSHTGERPYKCLQCLRTFVSNGVLKSHIRIHTGMKQYKCVMCDNMFSTNGSLKRHMSTHSDVRPFMCPYCQRTFKTNVNCKKHMKTHRHELAMQRQLQQQQNNGTDLPQTDEPQMVQETEYVEEEAVDNDLTLVQQELQPAPGGIAQPDLGQQTILTQAGLQDALGLNNTSIDQQLLNQQMFGQQQTFTQSLLGTNQQNFQSMNNMTTINQQNQFTIQQQPQHITLQDLNAFSAPAVQQTVQQTVQQIRELEASTAAVADQGTSATDGQSDGQALSGDEGIQADQLTTATSLPSTSMQNILETREPQDGELSDEDIEDAEGGEEEEEEEEAGAQSGAREDGPRTYTCQYCDKVYKKSSHLKQHIRSHTGEKPYKCSRCDKTFVSKGVVRQHLRTHMGIKEYKCNVCSAMFTTNGSLTRHMNIHVTLKPYKCPYCLEAFRTAAICKRHMKSHIGGRAGTDGEDEAEDTEEKQEQRRPKTHLVEVTPQVLAKATTEDVTLSERILIESASERERVSEVKELTIQHEDRHPHMCTFCPKSFKKPSDLVRHTRIHTGEKPFACGICGRTFTVKSTLDSHMKTHGGLEKCIKCHVCNSLFSTKGSLKVHMRLHTGAKPFRCPHCVQRFRTSGHRKSHILSHYKPENSARKKRSALNNPNTISLEEVPANQPLDFLNTVDAAQQQTSQPVITQVGQGGQVSQVINLDQSMLQGQNVLPLSVTVDNYGNLTESAMAAQVLQGLEGLQLHLAGSGNIAQGIQITGLDPSMFNQTLQIDANLLQQLQSGNVNLTFSSNQIQSADPNLVQSLGNIQVQPIPIQDGINPNMVVQPISMDAATATGTQQGIQAQEVAPSSFVVAADGSVTEQQPQLVQPVAVEVDTSSQTQQQNQQADNASNIVTVSNSVTGETSEITVVNADMSAISDVNNQIGVSSSMHVVASDLDPETGAMTAIDPNMTNDMDIAGDIMTDGQVDHAEDSDNDLDNEIIQDTADDSIPEELTDERLMRAQDVGQTFVIHNSIRNHKCTVCSKMFKRASHLKEHMQIHMKTESRKEKFQTYKCPFCEKAFHKPSQMERHVRIHTGERPFICSLCHKAFNQKNALQMHLKKHSGDKPHKCQYCTMCFTQKGNLKTHIKRAHHTEMVSSMNLNKMIIKAEHAEDGDQDEEEDGQEDTMEEGEVVSQEDLNLVEVTDLFNN